MIRIFHGLTIISRMSCSNITWSYSHSSLDCRRPVEWFPLARQLRRKIIAHLGPTNSGKTHAALLDLKASESGLYAAPLRLLAVEVGEQLRQTLPTAIITGQEISSQEGSTHTSCTIEMVSTDRHLRCAVIDEIQLLADESRGWAFTRALLGIAADTLHVCGSPEILPLLSKLVSECGDDLVVIPYQRLSRLIVQNRPLDTLAALQEGDCLIAFSRREVHSLKREALRLQNKDGMSVSVIYGGLPPLSRKHQASAFNSLDGKGVLVATDAIGMGLNLKIKRIVFSSLLKFDGKRRGPLSCTEARQIAGRAGRYQHDRRGKDEAGYVTALHEDDLRNLHKRLKEKPMVPRQACILPRSEDILSFAKEDCHPNSPFNSVLARYASNSRTSGLYFMGSMDQIISLAKLLQGLSVFRSREELLTFCLSPTDPNDSPVVTALLRFAKAFSSSGLVAGDLCVSSKHLKAPSTEGQLKDLEARHRILDLYVWLSYRFESQFPDRRSVEGMRGKCSDLIQEGLEKLGRSPRRHAAVDDTWTFQFNCDERTEFESDDAGR